MEFVLIFLGIIKGIIDVLLIVYELTLTGQKKDIIKRKRKSMKSDITLKQINYVGGFNASGKANLHSETRNTEESNDMKNGVEKKLNKESETILMFLEKYGEADVGELSRFLKIPESKVRLYMKFLDQLNLIEFVKREKHLYFKINRTN